MRTRAPMIMRMAWIKSVLSCNILMSKAFDLKHGELPHELQKSPDDRREPPENGEESGQGQEDEDGDVETAEAG